MVRPWDGGSATAGGQAMRIERLAPNADLYRQYSDDLARLLDIRDRVDRPCSGCDFLCSAHKSSTCTCACAPNCTAASEKMSSDGKKFPIERGIVPLVLAFLQLREFSPCWSCGGHEAGAGAEARPPRIIFYARSTLYPTLVAEAVATLLFQRKLICPWVVAVTPIGNMLDATYTLQPKLDAGTDLTLDQLQADVSVIADSLKTGVLNAAQRYQSELQAAIQGPAPGVTQ